MRIDERRFGPRACGEQTIAYFGQDGTIRLARGLCPVSRREGRAGYRQFASERVDLAQIEVGRHPARQPGRLSSDFRRHVWIPVAVAADPRSECHRGRIERQPLPRGLHQGAVDAAEIFRDGIPEALLEDHEPGADFIERRHTVALHFVGLPCRRDLTMELFERLLPLGWRQVGPIAEGQEVRDAIVFLDQRAPRDLGRMCRQNQLHAHRAERPHEIRGRHALLEQAIECFLARSALEPALRIARVIAPAADAMVLLGDVGEMQEVSERASERQRGLDRHLAQQIGEPVEVGRVFARTLGERAYALDAFEQAFIAVFPEHASQQLAEEPYIISKWKMRLRSRFLRRCDSVHRLRLLQPSVQPDGVALASPPAKVRTSGLQS